MAASYLIRLCKLKGSNGILAALNHNKREINPRRKLPENIDTIKTHLNYDLVSHDTAQKIATRARVLVAAAGIVKTRTNAVMGVEILFSLPVSRHKQETRTFFVDCFNWVKKIFNGELLSFDVHLDESAPHAHAIILPLIDSKLQGHKMVGDRANLFRIINAFYEQVGKKHGLSKNESKRLNQNDKDRIVSSIRSKLENDAAMKSIIWPCIRDAIQQDPLPYAQLLGIDVIQTTSKTFQGIMTSKGKGNSLQV